MELGTGKQLTLKTVHNRFFFHGPDRFFKQVSTNKS